MTIRTVADVMTSEVVAVSADATVTAAAQQMREHHIGDVLVVEDGSLVGMVTDRDLAVRVLAEKRDPSSTPVGEISSAALVSVGSGVPTNDAVELMRAAAIRRLPVVTEGQHPIGIVSIGDLAMAHDERSALAGISAALPNT